MIVEQAFHVLPEVLLGHLYLQQDYEAGIVGLFSLAILQELNGRNAPNPLSFLRAESLYEPTGFKRGTDRARYLRADLKLNVARLGVSSKRLRTYGWREESWIEAKFMRSPNDEATKVSQATANTALLLADMLRLATLVSEQTGKESTSARYLLHVYDAPPHRHLSEKSTSAGGTKSFIRDWVEEITTPGQKTVKIEHLEDESKFFRDKVGHDIDLAAKIEVTNFTQLPRGPEVPGHRRYWCYLTRLDKIEITMGGMKFTLTDTGKLTEVTTGDFHRIRGMIGGRLGVNKKSEEKAPETSELDES